MKKLSWRKIAYCLASMGVFVLAWLMPDLFLAMISKPDALIGIWFTVAWAVLFAAGILILPRWAGRSLFAAAYAVNITWTLIQGGYYCVFGKLMWLRDLFYVSEGVGFLPDTLRTLPGLWWAGGIVLIGLWILLIWRFPKRSLPPIPVGIFGAAALGAILLLPGVLFRGDSAYGEAYEKLPNAKSTYSVCGLYQLTVRDLWGHVLGFQEPESPEEKEEQSDRLADYFTQRGEITDNEMTGIFADKNIVLVLMESMDDWLITPEETPTIYRLMDEGIDFTQFYTPGFGTTRTLNAEFAMNSGLYLPTDGNYVFDYLDNCLDQSLAYRAAAVGYSPQVFHYNTPDFYSRGDLEPALGYEIYHSYTDYLDPENPAQIYDEDMLFDVPALRDAFFREGKTLNTVITRSAHLGYTYEEELSEYALTVYPEYRGKYSCEEEDCIRAKARLVDDFFARLLEELEAEGCLENTVIVGMTDHLAYGMDDTDLLMALSGVETDIMLERTPCFVWSADGPSMDVEKTLQTVDLVPTVLNLMGFDRSYEYIGRDAFDPDYPGYAFFPDGSWLRDGAAYRQKADGEVEELVNLSGRILTEEEKSQMPTLVAEFIDINNRILSTDYYAK